MRRGSPRLKAAYEAARKQAKEFGAPDPESTER